jgi:thiol-disulfide isomerase/thioredoxin
VGFQYECKDEKLKHDELVKLNRFNNKCPKCKKYAMMFEEGEILWD